MNIRSSMRPVAGTKAVKQTAKPSTDNSKELLKPTDDLVSQDKFIGGALGATIGAGAAAIALTAANAYANKNGVLFLGSLFTGLAGVAVGGAMGTMGRINHTASGPSEGKGLLAGLATYGVGLAAGANLGPAGVLAAAGVGAYVGTKAMVPMYTPEKPLAEAFNKDSIQQNIYRAERGEHLSTGLGIMTIPAIAMTGLGALSGDNTVAALGLATTVATAGLSYAASKESAATRAAAYDINEQAQTYSSTEMGSIGSKYHL